MICLRFAVAALCEMGAAKPREICSLNHKLTGRLNHKLSMAGRDPPGGGVNSKPMCYLGGDLATRADDPVNEHQTRGA
jgi:hypothetical protein